MFMQPAKNVSYGIGDNVRHPVFFAQLLKNDLRGTEFSLPRLDFDPAHERTSLRAENANIREARGLTSTPSLTTPALLEREGTASDHGEESSDVRANPRLRFTPSRHDFSEVRSVVLRGAFYVRIGEEALPPPPTIPSHSDPEYPTVNSLAETAPAPSLSALDRYGESTVREV